MIPHADMVTRLISHYHRADGETIAQGRAWYPGAAEVAAFLMPQDPARGAAVIAALSPRTHWADNVSAAACVIREACAGPLRVIRSNVEKARAVAAGAELSEVFKAAPKVEAFARAIAGDPSAVVVDSHAYFAATGERDRWGLRPNRYGRVAQAYADAAALVGESPRDMQAIVWVAVRGSAE